LTTRFAGGQEKKMADKEQIYSSGKIPVDLSGNESWMGGDINYALGTCTFKVLGYSNVNGPKKQIFMVHQILAGPETTDDTKDANKGKRFRRVFTMDKTESLNFLKAYCTTIGGPDGLVAGRPNMDVIAGTVFKANLFDKPYMKKVNGQDVERHGFDFDLNTVEIISRGNGAAANASSGGSGGFAPVQ
jgi:hypothetical protein